ncbi:MAG: carboxypeptidase-like regulatory domain-containing protein [Myxococcota bacterium]
MPGVPPRIDRLVRALAAAPLLVLACAKPPLPEAGSTVIWGYVRLVPKAGTEASGGGYGDRRLAEVRRIDYSEMKFAVVFAPDVRSERTEPVELVIRDGGGGPRLDPPFASTSPVAGLRVRNASATDQIVSIPEADRIARLAPGESRTIDTLQPGELAVHLLGIHDARPPQPTHVWVTEGATAIADRSGRYELRGLAPGPHTLRAWHPRLPPSPAHRLELERDSVVRHDLEIGLDVSSMPPAEARP